MSDAVTPFYLAIPEAQIDDLNARLRLTRWPEKETVDDWRQGAPLPAVQALCDHWLNRYDWRRCEAMLKGFGQFRTELDGPGIHFLHVRSPYPDATPLLMTHGWPGSVIEFHKVIGPLTDPAAHGGDPADAFHIVAPSLPGYGFSDRPTDTGWTSDRIATAWTELMKRLGYHRFVAQGATGVRRSPPRWGSRPRPNSSPSTSTSSSLRRFHRRKGPKKGRRNRSRTTARLLSRSGQRLCHPAAHPSPDAGLRPDRSAGRAAWIFEKFYEWTDCHGDPLNALGYDEMLDNIMLYWLTATGASSARLYWESFLPKSFPPVTVPTACSLFSKEIVRPSREAAARRYRNIFYWNAPERGGHFAAFEQPALFVREIRDAFRKYLGGS